MANCVSCGKDISVQDIIAGKYKKVGEDSYCLPCAPATSPKSESVKASASSASRSAASRETASRETASRETAARSSASRSEATRSTSATTSSSRGSASSRTRSRGSDEAEETGERVRGGYAKKEDQTFKIFGGIAVGLVLIAGIVIFTVTSKVSRETEARETALLNSNTAVEEMKRFLATRPGDDQIEEVEAYVAQREPLVLEGRQAEVQQIKGELANRKEVRTKKREFAAEYDWLLANIESADKAEEAQKRIEVAERLLGQLGSNVDDAKKRDFAAFKIKNSVAILEAKYNKALAVREQDPQNWPAITKAFTYAEETMSDSTQQLIRSGVPGSERAKELLILVKGEVNRAAEEWGPSTQYGFAATPPKNLLDPQEFTANGPKPPHWTPTDSAKWELRDGKMILTGLQPLQQGKSMRAGVLNWGPSGNEVFVVNGQLEGVLRNYELKMKFTVVRKGFTLLARQSKGYQRHSFSFETLAAQQETRADNEVGRKEEAAGGGGVFDIGSNLDVRTPAGAENDGTAFVVEEGKTYEVTQTVLGNKVWILAQAKGDVAPDPLMDQVTARYGGIGFQINPQGEVHFEEISIKILN